MKHIKSFISLLLTLCMVFSIPVSASAEKITLETLPEYSDNAYVELNNNKPQFTKSEKKNKKPFEKYSDLDELGRCGTAFANICQELMPTEER